MEGEYEGPEGVYDGLYIIAVVEGNAVGSKYVTDLNLKSFL